MLFNSFAFAAFLPIVFTIYWAIGRRRVRAQNFFLIVASYVFYGWWDWRFLSLIFISSLVDYMVGLGLAATEQERRRKLLLMVSLVVNLGFLGFFKYFNFFVDSFVDLLTMAGLQAHPTTLRIVLPVGISFYTFQTLSYSIDIYRRKIEPTRDPVAFFAFVSFFPQLVAGPIERAKSLLPQFLEPRRFDGRLARDGLRQMLWGFFKKMVIADNMAGHVDRIFADYTQFDGLTLVLGAFFFTIQVYGDFSGYSDIAIGASRLFGFSLMRNFAFPYFSRDFAEFWRRWHISLSTWFRDYLFIPLGGSRCSRARRIFNIVVTFTVSGLWHGADWTYVFWGFLNGLYYIPLMLTDRQKKYTDIPAQGRLLPKFGEWMAMLGTFGLHVLGLAIFRSPNITSAFGFLGRLFERPYSGMGYGQYFEPLLLCGFLLVVDWFQRDKQYALDLSAWPLSLRWLVYVVVILGIMVLGNFGSQEFIYFQF